MKMVCVYRNPQTSTGIAKEKYAESKYLRCDPNQGYPVPIHTAAAHISYVIMNFK